MVAAPAPVVPQAPSQWTSHGDLSTAPSITEPGSVHSAIKSAKICDFIVLRFLKSSTCFECSIAHLLILPKLSLLLNISFND
jgi:hypothetical protein